MHSMRNLYPVALIVGPAVGYLLYLSVMSYPYVNWLFYFFAAGVLFTTTVGYMWIEVQDLPEPFSYW
jgi:hypothetical protein